MKKSTLGLVIILTLLAILLGWNYFKHPFATSNQAAVTTTPAPDTTAQPVAGSSNLATSDQKIAALIAYPVVIPNLESTDHTATRSATVAAAVTGGDTFLQDLAWIGQHHPGVITLFGSKISTSSAQTAIAQIKAQYPPDQPPLFAVDHEGGTTQRLNGTGFTVLPSWQSLCAESATASAQLLTTSLAEVKQTGINIILGPVVDVSAHQPVLGSRVCSGDNQVVVQRATQFAQIATNLHLLPVFKHFPGIGASHLDLHQTFDRVTVTPNDALVYKQLLDQFPTAGVMVSHIGVINQFPDKPCSLSSDCVAELITNYPQTLVVTDALDMKAASFLPSLAVTDASPSGELKLTLPEVSLAAVRAGDQVLLFSQAVTADQMTDVIQHLINTYNQDQSFQSQVNKADTQLQAVRSSLLTSQ